MPTYAYRCRQCGHDLEVVQAFTDGPLTECPECHGALRKLYSPVGISFKGGGFYKTDSRSGSSASSTAAKDSPAKDGGSKDGGSKESATSTTKESSSSTSSSNGSSSSSTPSPTPSSATPSSS